MHKLAALLTFIALPCAAAPLYPNSVVSNDIDFIQADDPSTFGCFAFTGQSTQEMPDKRGGDLFAPAFTFQARFTDGSNVDIWAHADLGQDTAAQISEQIASHLGRLPYVLRANLDHIVLHKGNETAFAEDQAAFFVLYSDNVKSRIGTHDLEETLFHESMHAVLQTKLLNEGWRDAVAADNAFITDYAQSDPGGEDIAESGLFGFTYLRNPERLPAHVTTALPDVMPNRLDLLKQAFAAPEPVASHTPSCQ